MVFAVLRPGRFVFLHGCHAHAPLCYNGGMNDQQSAYARAGVDIDAATDAVERMKSHIAGTRTPGVLTDTGSFGGMFALGALGGLQDPVLVSSIDGVGTKVMLAFATGRHDTIGRDLVSHCVNDVLVQGARPLFFLDYLGVGKVEPAVAEAVVAGLAQGCRAVGCALLGGETAEMPALYAAGEYDLAGCIVGIVERARIVDGAAARAGDIVIGLASDGLHTNGYSLARKALLQDAGLALDAPQPALGGTTLADALLAPHRCYAPAVLPLLDSLPVPATLPGLQNGGHRHSDRANAAGPPPIHAMAHITGGGFWDNIPRVLPPGVGVRISRSAWEVPPLFRLIQQTGSVSEDEMFRVFNMGIGYVLVVAPESVEDILLRLQNAGERAFRLGEAIAGTGVVFTD